MPRATSAPPDRLHPAPLIFAQESCVCSAPNPAAARGRAAQAHALQLRLDARLLPQYDAIYCSGCSSCTRDHDRSSTAWPPQRRDALARSATRRACTCSPGGDRMRPNTRFRDAPDAGGDDQRVRLARRLRAAVLTTAQTPSARRAKRSKRWSGRIAWRAASPSRPSDEVARAHARAATPRDRVRDLLGGTPRDPCARAHARAPRGHARSPGELAGITRRSASARFLAQIGVATPRLDDRYVTPESASRRADSPDPSRACFDAAYGAV